MVHLDVGLLTLISGLAIPFITGIVTKYHAPRGVKAITTLGLSAAATAVQYAMSVNGVVDLKRWATTAGVTWALGILAYYGLYEPTGISEAVNSATATFGIGAPAIVNPSGGANGPGTASFNINDVVDQNGNPL